MESFWESCGARGPLILDIEGEGDSRATRHSFDRPSLLIGSGPRSDLLLDHREVSRRHAYIQVIAGRPFCVDLDSRTGTYVGDGTSVGGWVIPDRPIQIGHFQIRARVGDLAGENGPAVDLSPLSGRGSVSDTWPRATLEVERRGGALSIPIGRMLSLIGRSRRCKIRLATPKASRFHGALLRTPAGIWVVDLRSSTSISVNGASPDHARLVAGDEIRVGPLVARVCETETASRRSPLAPTISEGREIARPLEPSAGDLRALLDQVADIQQHSSDQIRQVIVMVTQLFGSMHRETIDLVREELEEVRNLAREVKAFREESAKGRADSTSPVASDRMPSGRTTEVGPAFKDPCGVGPGMTRDAGEIHLIVSERLAAFERERSSRWNQLSKILGKNNS